MVFVFLFFLYFFFTASHHFVLLFKMRNYKNVYYYRNVAVFGIRIGTKCSEGFFVSFFFFSWMENVNRSN